MASLVFTVIGRDHPGLVELIANCVAEHQGNWEESQFMSLDGQFAGLIRVQAQGAQIPALRAGLEALADLKVVVADQDAPTLQGQHHFFDLDLVGADHPGIVRDIGRGLAAMDINIAKLDSWTERAPMSGEPTFRARIKIDVPAGTSQADVLARLEPIANDLMVEFTLVEDDPV